MAPLFRKNQPRVASTDPGWERREQHMTAQQYERMIPQAYPLFAHQEGAISAVIGWLPYRDEDEPGHELEEGSYVPVLVALGYYAGGGPWKANLVEQSRMSYFMTEEQAEDASKLFFEEVAESAERPKVRKPPTKGSA